MPPKSIAERCREVVDKYAVARLKKEVEEGGKEWLRAIEILLAYGYGKPNQKVELEVSTIPRDALQAKLAILEGETLAKIASGEVKQLPESVDESGNTQGEG